MSLTNARGWLDLQGAASYLSLSVRNLRSYLGHDQHPLPMHRIGGKWIGRVMDFDRWAESFPKAAADIDQIVDEIMSGIEDNSSR
ncbi:MAG: helix-turn-helix domain-containing protein [bacterium]|nr:helix-turn-helix domain-containing protein [bacterium]